ncbi:hypothetical protein ILUMI_05685 [Ignelater luminosus]|uniref:Protein quiver n=1 Tax=Ignelater luminosus TaxID=2038154 RepID=A0A8K0DBT4_IGNLU|nr:hypothetical protein ILUMI_05685 [Ignelater luminosus]
MANYKYFLLFAATFITLIEEGYSIKCYQCKAKRDEPCGYPTDTNGVRIEECPTDKPYKCYHYDYNVDGHKDYEQFVERGCMQRDLTACPSKKVPVETLNYQCKMCLEEKCNKDSTMLKPHEQGGTGGGGGDGDGSSSVTPTFIVCGVTLFILIKNMY